MDLDCMNIVMLSIFTIILLIYVFDIQCKCQSAKHIFNNLLKPLYYVKHIIIFKHIRVANTIYVTPQLRGRYIVCVLSVVGRRLSVRHKSLYIFIFNTEIKTFGLLVYNYIEHHLYIRYFDMTFCSEVIALFTWKI